MKPHRHFFLSVYGWTYWAPILLAGGGITLVLAVVAATGGGAAAWAGAAVVAVVTLAALAFFRDFPRAVPADDGVMVAPADGTVTEITRLEQYEPLGGATWRVGIFLSVLSVHVNRSPCAGVVLATEYREGLFLDARHPESGPKNQSHTLVLGEAGEAGDGGGGFRVQGSGFRDWGSRGGRRPADRGGQTDRRGHCPADHRAGGARRALRPRRALRHDRVWQPHRTVCAGGPVGADGEDRAVCACGDDDNRQTG